MLHDSNKLYLTALIKTKLLLCFNPALKEF